ncbi:MAG: hypothetical protein C7B44_05405 [Sulfobacillus thermosulfidooxidans]|nr:MAG: hypothetical protein C7B44_05405 [Sulfobacillus thermosulfidooxidans]
MAKSHQGGVVMPDWKSLKDKAMAAVNSAAQEVDHQLTLTNLRSQVTQAQAELDKAYQQLGQAVYPSLSQGQSLDPQFVGVAPAMAHIDILRQRLQSAQQALRDAEPVSRTPCPSCGALVDAGDKFCGQCGHAMR